MKPFKLRSERQQRYDYIRACRRQLAHKYQTLKDRYRAEHDQHARLYVEKCEIERNLAAVQNRVADEADKEFGGWDVWRHDEVLLLQVVKRMEEAVTDHRQRIEDINFKMSQCLEKFNVERAAFGNYYSTLIQTTR